jgi:hypothetical protein
MTWHKKLINCFKDNPYGVAGFADFSCLTDEDKKEIHKYFQDCWWEGNKNSEIYYAAVLYEIIGYAQKQYEDGAFYDKFDSIIRIKDTERQKVSDLFCKALEIFGYFYKTAEVFYDAHKFITPYLIHAGIPDTSIDNFVKLIAVNRHIDYRHESSLLGEVVKKSDVHKNVKRIFQLYLAGMDEIWFRLTDAINAFYNEEREDCEFYLGELPTSINRKRIITALKNSQNHHIETASKISKPYIKFNSAFRNFIVSSKEELNFAQESTQFLEKISNKYEWVIIRPPESEKLQLNDGTNISLFFEQDSVKMILFDTKTYRLISPEEIERKGLSPTKYLVFVNQEISLLSCDISVDSGDWSFYGFCGTEIDFASENHQKQTEYFGTLYFDLKNGQTITFLRNRFDEVNTVKFIDDTGNILSPIMHAEVDIVDELIYIPIFNAISCIRFSSPKTKEIQLYKYNQNNKKWEYQNVDWTKIAKGDFHCNSKINDGIYQVRDKSRASKREVFVIISDFQKLREEYNADGSEFEVTFTLPTSGQLKDTEAGMNGRLRSRTTAARYCDCRFQFEELKVSLDKPEENKNLQSYNNTDNICFKMSTRYPLTSLIWEWNDTALGSFSLYFPLKGLRWRIVSLSQEKDQEKIYDYRWTDKPIIVNPDNVPIEHYIELHLPEKKNIIVNGNFVKTITKLNEGGKWNARLNDYRNSEQIILTLNDKEIPLVYFAKQPIIEKFEWTASGDIAEIRWTGYVPENTVFLIWDPLKPASSFREITLQNGTSEILIDNIDSEIFYCFTIANKHGGWRGQFYNIAVHKKIYDNKIKRCHIGLSQEKKGSYEEHFYLLFQNLLDEKFAKDCPFDYVKRLRAEEFCRNEKDKELYFCVLKLFCEEMKNLDECFKNTLEWDKVNKEFGIDRYAELSGKWLPSLLQLVENDNSRKSIHETFIEETKNGMNFAWLKPYQIAEYDCMKNECMKNEWERYTDCPTPFEYFRDLWLISSSYHQVKILSTCAEKNNCQYISNVQFKNNVTHWRIYNKCNSCGKPLADHKDISIDLYVEYQKSALQRLLNFHKKFQLPTLEKLIQIKQLSEEFIVPDIKTDGIPIIVRKYSEELSSQLGLEECEILLLDQFSRDLSTMRTGYKFVYNPLQGNSKISRHRVFQERIINELRPRKLDPAVPLVAKVNTSKWIETYADVFRNALVQWNNLTAISTFTLSTNAINYLKDILDAKHVLLQLIEKTCTQKHSQEKNSNNNIHNEIINETIKQLWQHAVLERLFVNSSADVKEKLGNESQKLEQYLRETTSEIYKSNLIAYYRIQMLAELAVWICYNGGIGMPVKTEFT